MRKYGYRIILFSVAFFVLSGCKSANIDEKKSEQESVHLSEENQIDKKDERNQKESNIKQTIVSEDKGKKTLDINEVISKVSKIEVQYHSCDNPNDKKEAMITNPEYVKEVMIYLNEAYVSLEEKGSIVGMSDGFTGYSILFYEEDNKIGSVLGQKNGIYDVYAEKYLSWKENRYQSDKKLYQWMEELYSKSSTRKNNPDKIQIVRLDGKLYYDANKESEIKNRSDKMDGKINSQVEINEIPFKSNQSNFGVGYGYQYIDERSVDVYIVKEGQKSGTWRRYELKNK